MGRPRDTVSPAVDYLDHAPQKIVRTLETHRAEKVVGVKGFAGYMRVLVKPAE